MSKPWEESWTAEKTNGWDNQEWAISGAGGQPLLLVQNLVSDEASAKLAAAAPEMARLLMKLADPRAGCASCRSVTVGVHHPWCEIEPLLSKAGVEQRIEPRGSDMQCASRA